MEPSTAGLAFILAAILAFGVAGATGFVGAKHPPLPDIGREAAPGPRATLSARWRSADALPGKLASRRAGRPRPAKPAAPPAAQPAAPPAPTGGTAAPGDPADAVAAYYAALDARQFDVAWRALSPAVHAQFGGFGAWRDGFATTRSSRPRSLNVTRSGDSATVSFVLEAADRAACGTKRRSFAARWQLSWDGSHWIASTVTARSTSKPTCSS